MKIEKIFRIFLSGYMIILVVLLYFVFWKLHTHKYENIIGFFFFVMLFRTSCHLVTAIFFKLRPIPGSLIPDYASLLLLLIAYFTISLVHFLDKIGTSIGLLLTY